MQSTSAIDDMSVAEVRKALSHMRREWANHSNIKPFLPANKIATASSTEMTMSEFSFRFIMGHHSKRHSHSRSQNTKADR